MTSIRLYCDHHSSGARTDADADFLRKQEDEGRYGFIRDEKEWTLDELLSVLVSEEERVSVRDNAMGVISAALSGERNPVLVTEDDGLLISLADQGPQVSVSHETKFRHFNEPDYHEYYVPLLGSEIEKAVEEAHLGFLVYPTADGFRYDAYAGQGQDFRHVGAAILPERPASWCSYDILAALARRDVLNSEMTELLGSDWKGLVPDEPTAAFGR